MTILELSQNIHKYVIDKNYDVALSYFKQNKTGLSNSEISNNEYLISDMISALRMTKSFNAAFKFLEIYDIHIDINSSFRLLNSYGWLIYSLYKSLLNDDLKNKDSLSNKKNVSEIVLNYLELINKQDNSYYNKLVDYLFKVIINYEKSKLNQDWQFISSLCEQVNPDYLSEECYNAAFENKGKNKEIELASTKEEWFVFYSKSLWETNRYKDCISVCNKACNIIKTLHYDNYIWFQRRIAQCQMKNNDIDSAIFIYKEIITKKTDWFILKEVSECFYKKGDLSKALFYAKKAASSFGPINFKVELFELIGDILEKQENLKLAWLHFRLVRKIREAENWKENSVLTFKLNNLAKHSENLDNLSKDQIKQKLIPFWNDKDGNEDSRGKSRLRGVVFKLLQPKSAGTDGFLKSDSGKVFYFFLPSIHPLYDKLKLDIILEFEPIETIKGDKAIKIKFIK